MTLTYHQISQEIFPAFNQLINSQTQGLVILPQKVGYAIGKIYTVLTKHARQHAKLKQALLEEYGAKDEQGNFKTIKVGNSIEYVFKEGQKPVFIEKANELSKTEVRDIKWHMISRHDLEKVDNFPISLFPILEEYEMITELQLDHKPLKVLN